jgi:transaldolase/glucose-6-phosphate isomerase
MMVSGELAERVQRRIAALETDAVAPRIWRRDASVWSSDPRTPELGDRLGWLDLARTMQPHVAAVTAFAEAVRGRFARVVLCGMGGSSLAPEVLWRTAGPRTGYPSLHLLDSTHPAAVRATVPEGALGDTLFLIASKSGTTIETASFERYFWAQTGGHGAQFVAITDPDTALARRGAEHGFRHVFLNPPDIGGRFSALSLFGLVPAALIGLDIERLLADARDAEAALRAPGVDNPAIALGALLGEGALAGRDKCTLVTDPGIATLGLWVEQLVAESTGKGGRGVLPVAGERATDLSGREPDRVFVVRTLDAARDSAAGLRERAVAAGAPVDSAKLPSPYGLGGEFLRWELATAVIGVVLGVNPFDQPNVAESKANTNRVLQAGTPPVAADDPMAIQRWLGGVRAGDYVAVMAYLPPSPAMDARLADVRRALARRLGVAVTVGYGPRFLHSTGQYHKGGTPRGHFLQVVDRPAPETPIPGAPYGFERLIAAQADGDLEALRGRGRPAIRVDQWDRLLEEVGA